MNYDIELNKIIKLLAKISSQLEFLEERIEDAWKKGDFTTPADPDALREW